MSDLYSDPGKFDLSIVGTAELGYAYDWDTFQIYEHLESGKYYYVHGAGCSCNDMGDYVQTLEDLTSATPAELHVALDEFAGTRKNDAEVVELHAKIASL